MKYLLNPVSNVPSTYGKTAQIKIKIHWYQFQHTENRNCGFWQFSVKDRFTTKMPLVNLASIWVCLRIFSVTCYLDSFVLFKLANIIQLLLIILIESGLTNLCEKLTSKMPFQGKIINEVIEILWRQCQFQPNLAPSFLRIF